jgi:colicin import membrane protein
MATADALLPQRADGIAPGAALSVAVHVGLIAALTLGVGWRMSAPEVVSAELWSALPQVAAPRAEEPPVPAPAPKPLPPPPAPLPREAAPPAVPDAKIAIEREKKAREEKEKAEADAKKKREADEKKREQAAKAAEAAAQKAEEARREKLREEQLKRMLGDRKSVV